MLDSLLFLTYGPSMREIILFSLFVLCPGLVITGCLSAVDYLDMARGSWQEGEYIEAIERAIKSYDHAVEKNQEVSDIQNARAYLLEHFPLASQYLKEKAEKMMAGSDIEKLKARKVYQQLVDMNSIIRDASVSSFLEFTDYVPELRKARETSAQIQYVKVLELMGKGNRSSYIEAYWLLKDINDYLPGYRDIESLMNTSVKKATLIVAMSNRGIRLDIRTFELVSRPDTASRVYQKIKKIMQDNDYEQFLRFITVSSENDARLKGAHIFVGLSGKIWIDSGVSDSYYSNGMVKWQRSYGGEQTLVIIKLNSGLSRNAKSYLDFRQAVNIEFYPVRFRTRELTSDLYYNSFNNVLWMDYQLSVARDAVERNKSEASLLVWAEMQYGGTAQFLDKATVDGVEMPVESYIYDSTQNFINTDLKNFIRFSDMDLESRISEEISEKLLVNTKSFLRDLAN